MTKRTQRPRVLVAQHRLPEPDRERGSQRVMDVIDALAAAGNEVVVGATELAGGERYVRWLRRRGFQVAIGPDGIAAASASGLDAAVIAFWHAAAVLMPIVRAQAPNAPIIVDSIDLHFVRESRRRANRGEPIDEEYTAAMAAEVAVYGSADSVWCVSQTEADLVDQMLGRRVAVHVPLGEDVGGAPSEEHERRGLLFVGNFRHLPNIEAVEWLSQDVVSYLSPELLRRDPIRIVGHAVDERVIDAVGGSPEVEIVGGVPSIEPELHRARVAMVPLRHGAGVKGKLLQAMMAGTPVVTTSVGIEGIDPTVIDHVLVADSPQEFAAHLALIVESAESPIDVAGARSWALEHHDARSVAPQISAAVAELIRSHAQGWSIPAHVDPQIVTASLDHDAAVANDAVTNPLAVDHSDRDLLARDQESIEISVVVATHERAELLDGCLASFALQTIDPTTFEVVVIDDGSIDDTTAVVDKWRPHLPLVHERIEHGGRAIAKNRGIELSAGPIVLLFDDDDRAAPDLLAVHLATHAEHPDERLAVLGHTAWASELDVNDAMRHATDVGMRLFAYPSLTEHQRGDWKLFWEGRISAKRSLLVGVGGHDPCLAYSIDIEMAWRIHQSGGLTVLYEPAARSVMARPIDLDQLLERCREKGRAAWRLWMLHVADPVADDALAVYGSVHRWREWPALRGRIDGWREDLALAEPDEIDSILHQLCDAFVVAGLWAEARADGLVTQPVLSVVIPVWSVTDELRDLAVNIIGRVVELATVPTEIIVVDNASPFRREFPADVVIRNSVNVGVGPAWNQGIAAAQGEVVVVLNSDCEVTSGWDRALCHAALDGRRIAFPHTDHGDGIGPVAPDQAGTAGWCFAASATLLDELGVFDEQFAPAFFEDTDYWHRAWLADVDLSPVAAAVVRHERRTSARHLGGVDEIFAENRRRYEAKWDLGFDAPPPYYAREIVPYPVPGRVQLRRLAPGSAVDQHRPRIFGIGLTKTATSSLHSAISHLGFRSIHHGDEVFRESIEEAIAIDFPSLHRAEDLDAFFDVPAVVDRFDRFDLEYPGSRFILSTRPLEPWIESRRRHVETNQRLRDQGDIHGAALDIDVDGWIEEWHRHHERVLSYFADRPGDLLVIDVCSGEGWEVLAPFVGWQRLPERTFPWENAADSVADAAGTADDAIGGVHVAAS